MQKDDRMHFLSFDLQEGEKRRDCYNKIAMHWQLCSTRWVWMFLHKAFLQNGQTDKKKTQNEKMD